MPDFEDGGALSEWLDACPVALDDHAKARIVAIVKTAAESAGARVGQLVPWMASNATGASDA